MNTDASSAFDRTRASGAGFRRVFPLLALMTLFADLLPLRGEADAIDGEIQALCEQIRLLDQRLTELQRQQRNDKEAAARASADRAAAAQAGATQTTTGSAPSKMAITDKGFTFASGDGQVWRVSPQSEYRNGPLGMIAEYVVSTVNARPAAAKPKTELKNRAWQLASGYVLTGENSSCSGVSPDRPFNWRNKTWGAWEVAARYGDLKIDPKAFPLFADPAVSASEAEAVGLGLNWYLSRTVRTTFDFYQTHFTNPVPVSASQLLQQDEQAFITRFQISFSGRTARPCR